VLRIAAVVLLLLWVLGLVTGRTMGGFVHVLLVLAMILGLIALVRGKNSRASGRTERAPHLFAH
jgi:hypothetical protein